MIEKIADQWRYWGGKSRKSKLGEARGNFLGYVNVLYLVVGA